MSSSPRIALSVALHAQRVARPSRRHFARHSHCRPPHPRHRLCSRRVAAMPLSQPPLLVVLVLLVCNLLAPSFAATASSSDNLVTSSVETCPCTFRVITERNAPTLNLFAVPHSAVSPNASSLLRELPDHLPTYDVRLSALRQRANDADATDALVRHHIVEIPTSGRFSLHVRPSTAAHVLRPRTHILVNSVSHQNNQCPNQFPNIDVRRNTAAIEANLTHTASLKLTDLTPRIVGGSPAGEKLASYLVFLLIRTNGGASQCTGVLVARNIVLTAAHCRVNLRSTAYVGFTRFPNTNGIPISSVKTHPRYNGNTVTSLRYDIAYVQLARDAPSTANTMLFNVNDNLPRPASVVRTAGYGIFQDGDESSNRNRDLYFVDVPVVSETQCKRAYQSDNVNYINQICAGFIGIGGCDSCQGDSGGPLFQYDEAQRPVLVGLVSVGNGCASPDFPGIYVRTSSFRTSTDNFLAGLDLQTSTEARQNAVSAVPSSSSSSRRSALSFVSYIAIGAAVAAIALCVLCLLLRKCCGRRKKQDVATGISHGATPQGPQPVPLVVHPMGPRPDQVQATPPPPLPPPPPPPPPPPLGGTPAPPGNVYQPPAGYPQGGAGGPATGATQGAMIAGVAAVPVAGTTAAQPAGWGLTSQPPAPVGGAPTGSGAGSQPPPEYPQGGTGGSSVDTAAAQSAGLQWTSQPPLPDSPQPAPPSGYPGGSFPASAQPFATGPGSVTPATEPTSSGGGKTQSPGTQPPPPRPSGSATASGPSGSMESDGPWLAFNSYDPYQSSRDVTVPSQAGPQPGMPPTGDGVPAQSGAGQLNNKSFPGGRNDGGAGSAAQSKNDGT